MKFKHNPGFSSDEEIIQTFVVRRQYLGMILETLRENKTSANQHVLIVGERGTGKTMLVRRVAAEVRTNPNLKERWYPLAFAEESYQISSVGEFWLEALFHLADQTQDESWQAIYEELRTEADEKRLRQRALAQLMDFADAQGKRILLVVENLNMLFSEQLNRHDDWELRHTLQNEPRLMLLGTATQRFEQIESIQKAWFEFFTIYQLEALSLEECQVLWTSIHEKSVNDNRIRPIQILTGGNPRLLRILIDFAGDLSLKNLMANLSQLIDEHTEYFKSHLDNLAASERKVFIALLEIWDPIGAREVATVCRMNVSQTSALLNRLVSRGAVTVKQGKSRKKLYQATERLYNIYYLMRRRSHPSSRVTAAVRLMVIIYQDDDLVDATSKIVNEACLLNPAQRAEHFHAYKGILDVMQKADLRAKLLVATPNTFLAAPDAPESLRIIVLSILHQLQKQNREELHEINQFKEGLHELKELFELGHYEEAIPLLEKVILNFESYPDRSLLANIIFVKGCALGDLGRSEEAITVYDDLINRFTGCTEPSILTLLANALLEKATRLGFLSRNEEAIEAYDELIFRFTSCTELSLLEQLAQALVNKGTILGTLGRSEEEILVYDELICRFSNCTELPLLENLAKALLNKGNTLDSLGRLEEAMEAYDELIDRLGNCTKFPLLGLLGMALIHKGYTLDSLGRPEEVVVAYDKLITCFSNCTETHLLDELLSKALVYKGFRLISLMHPEEAEQSWRKSLEIVPTNWLANYLLAALLLDQKKWTELWDRMPIFLTALEEKEEEATKIVINFLIQIAANGHAAKVLQIVSEAKVAADLEPLMVGLKIVLGEQPLVAQEILEVGQDVAQRIREKQQALQDAEIVELIPHLT
jgi:tetratricopeptide (TPR) repeat protein